MTRPHPTPSAALVRSLGLAFAALFGAAAAQAQDVVSELSPEGALVLTGDAMANHLQVTTSGDALVVSPVVGTIDGQDLAIEVTGATSLTIIDEGLILDVIGVQFDGPLRCGLVGPSDAFFDSSTLGEVRVESFGPLAFEMVDCVLSRKLRVVHSGAAAGMILTDSTIGGDLKVNFSDAAGNLDVSGCTIAKRVRVRSTGGSQTVLLAGGTVVQRTVDARANKGDLDFRLQGNSMVERGLRARARQGNSVHVLTDATIGRSANLRTARDGGTVTLSSVQVGRQLSLRGNKGDDVFAINGSSAVGRRLRVNGGGGANTFTALGLDVTRKMSYSGGTGDDMVTLTGIDVGEGKGRSQFNLRRGNNSLVANGASVFDGNVRVRAGSGDDVVDFGNATVSGTFDAKSKSGDDTITPP